MVAATGDLGAAAAPSIGVAIVLVLGGLATTLVSSWLNRRSTKRRTEPANTGGDLLRVHRRVDVAEENLADTARRVTRVEGAFDDLDDRVRKLETRRTRT